ncbi:hypothetical protein AaE_012371 [Aphanomyces astaci]|uniref:DDE-1 domain-containing protein n=1 Tax=Aphanomyces astaci TaxID=112090 RepID=A0A6A4Z896_APHAT|nr:hypothetical protein AaE_012371 [Aphanomyces astaci]
MMPAGSMPTTSALPKAFHGQHGKRGRRRRPSVLNPNATKKHVSLGGQGKKPTMIFGEAVVASMKEVRSESHTLTTMHMITWIKTYQPHWIEEYMSNKVSNIRAYQALMLLCQRFAHRNGFSQRIPCYSKLKMHELQEVQRTYAASLWTQRHDQPLRGIVNVDETAVYYDMPPPTTWCLVGEDSKVDSSEMNSDRLTAVMSICADAHVLSRSYNTVDEELYGFIEATATELHQCVPVMRRQSDVSPQGQVAFSLVAGNSRRKMVVRTISAWQSISELSGQRSFQKALLRIFEEQTSI